MYSVRITHWVLLAILYSLLFEPSSFVEGLFLPLSLLSLSLFLPLICVCICIILCMCEYEHVCCGLCCPLQDPLDNTRSVIVIRSLVPGGVAEGHGGLLPGDQLVFVNDTYLDTCTLSQAVDVLKAAPPGTVYLGIRKPLGVSLYSEWGYDFISDKCVLNFLLIKKLYRLVTFSNTFVKYCKESALKLSYFLF